MTRSRTSAALVTAVLLAVPVGGCVTNPFGDGVATTGRKAAPIAGTEPSKGDGRANSFSQFDDIPIPVDADMDLGQTLILGDNEGWIGRLSLDVGHAMTDMYSFYEQEMPRFGWERITTVRARISTLTYQRGARIATITLQPTLTDGTLVDFTVAPARAGKTAPVTGIGG
ncbi:MAG: hypothetical protein P1U88_22895 [Thalassobaculaceae bacterium]|nr:hypothetical protein [Thalassobaculaceae bacterium]